MLIIAILNTTNFSHWISMDYDITRKMQGLNEMPIEEWTRWHWERTSAVQCCHGQPRIDKAIPVYFKHQNPNRRPVLSHILISDKARISSQKSDLDEVKREHRSIAPDYSGLPYIAILVDLAVDKSDFDVWVDSSGSDMCLRVYASGLDATTYPFLKDPVKLTRILKGLYR
ncbi:hypothetical protein OG21DRAFT_1501671 [Imleria badia]|nr:hypothetical protein OG21DRAFT_1501671 [Imleria badia]